MGKDLTNAVARAIERAPCSLRALANEAGLAPSTLSRIRSGKRSATPEVARAVAEALDRWGERCGELARSVRQAERRDRKRRRAQ